MKGNWLQRWLISWLEQCFMRRAPQDDAATPAMLQVAVVAYLAVDLLQALPGASWTVAVGMSLVDTLFMVLFCWLLLRVTDRPARFVQTLTALAGTGAVLGVAALPMIWQAGNAPEGATPGAMLVLAWLLLLVWSVAVKAHIFRHALSSPYAAGVLIAVLHTLLAIMLLSYLFPQAAG